MAAPIWPTTTTDRGTCWSQLDPASRWPPARLWSASPTILIPGSIGRSPGYTGYCHHRNALSVNDFRQPGPGRSFRRAIRSAGAERPALRQDGLAPHYCPRSPSLLCTGAFHACACGSTGGLGQNVILGAVFDEDAARCQADPDRQQRYGEVVGDVLERRSPEPVCRAAQRCHLCRGVHRNHTSPH